VLNFLFKRTSGEREELIAAPLQGELLGAERLAERGRTLASERKVTSAGKGRRRTPLLARLDGTQAILERAHARLGADSKADVGPAGEWLLDNFYVVQEHIREVRESLPRGYYRQLPELTSGPLAGYPRVYEMAITLIAHTEGRIDLRNVELFVEAFQKEAPLTIGELWAMPAMLRLGLIENLRRMALRTVKRLDEIEQADAWARRIQGAAEVDSDALSQALSDFVVRREPLTADFICRVLQQLRHVQGSPTLVRLEQWIGEEGLGAEDAAARSTQRLAHTQLMMANSITSLRAISHRDWRHFVDRQSRLETALIDDPAGAYPRMTFASRDEYRHVVERMARRTGRDEAEVARQAIHLARQPQLGGDRSGENERRSHVGFYLIDGGRAELERVLGYRPHLAESIHRFVLAHPNLVFVGGIALWTVAVLLALLAIAPLSGQGPWSWLLVAAFALLPAVDLAVNLVNQLVTTFLPPQTLPKLDLGENNGIPASLRTAVVVPTLLANLEAVPEALGNLETLYLANRGAHLHFALLTDFTDSPTETRDGDAEILAAAVEGVRALNARYAPDTQDALYLFHRPRRWNQRQGVWMGWERKRGKLSEFNRFLRGGPAGASAESFSAIVGDVAAIRKARYVITLDADTVLPPQTAHLLVGTLAHPLNRPVYDPEQGRMVSGYGIIQPRVVVSLPSAHRSRFSAIHSGHPGVDPYTTAVSDVYQDLYREGSFTGKGIYDLDAFEQATHGRFPENTLLSHDLIEGNYARAGLATDITVYDDYPTRYETYTRRRHRWIRGDWQLLGWLGRWVPGPDGRERNRLSLLSRWKILDNLRRSTTEIAQLLFLLAGWTVLPGSAVRWTLLGLGLIAAPWMVTLLLALVRPPADKSWRAYYATVGQDALLSLQQVSLAVAFLPYQAWVSADAIVRTLWRLLCSRRRLLDWQTARQVESSARGTAAEAWRVMWPALLLVAAMTGLVAGSAWLQGGPSLRLWHLARAVVPLILLWSLSPVVAHDLASPALPPRKRLGQAGRGQALRYALLHWRFFDRFVTAETSWLPPDNYQDDPVPVVAMRTSPTNVGLQLLATASAHRLGFIGIESLVRRLELAFDSMDRLRKFRGHFYNWYDLHDLRVLEPAYISTVDSGNLAGHLIALRQFCLQLIDEPLLDERIWRGLVAGLGLSIERLVSSPSTDPAVATIRKAAGLVRLAQTALLARETTPGRPATFLPGVDQHLRAARAALGEGASAAASEWIDWSLRLIAEQLAHLQNFAAWLPGATPEPGAASPSWRDLALRSPAAAALVQRLQGLADRAHHLAMGMDFTFLYDSERKLFAIGYQEASHAVDGSLYDLLASEARLASFLAIAKGDVGVDHWFRLGRSLTRSAAGTALVSWSGSMFEYLMPLLVMRSYPFTLIEQTHSGAVRAQMAYGAERGVPWGISESAYNLRDRHFTYQYRAFGVPELALKRGLGRDLVVAPYASLLATMVHPRRALLNLQALEKLGALGAYGFRDAIDYTRPDPGKRFAVVHSYMAHHIGMGVLALANLLEDDFWQRRFHADPLVRSAELLLHERVPRAVVLNQAQRAKPTEALPDPELDRPAEREVDSPFTLSPRIALLGHMPYTIMISQCGSGYSRYEDLAVTRWRADATRDHTGQFCYIKDLDSRAVWSAAHQPVCAPADWFGAVLSTDRVTFRRVDGDIESRTEVVAVPADAAEVRRVTVTNNGQRPRLIELTSYGEIVLNPPDSDRVHPAFTNLFIETEWHEWCSAVTATRRPRSARDRSLWCVHVVATGPERVGPVTCETDRGRFLGRGRSTRDPVALENDGPLSGATGAVLDPIFALRTRVRLQPGQSASVAFTTLVATSRERAFELADRYDDLHSAQRALDLAWTASQIELRELRISPRDAAVFQDLAGHLFYSHPGLRVPRAELLRNHGSQALLWGTGLSGDWPIVLATIESADGLPTLRQLFAAHHYWRRRGMTVDLVLINEHPSSYFQELNDRIMESRFASGDAGLTDRAGGVFVRRHDELPPEDLLMLRATARVLVPCDGRPLGQILVNASKRFAMDAVEEEPTPVEPLAAEPPPRMPARGSQQQASMTPNRGVPIVRMTPLRGSLAVVDSGAAPGARTPGGRSNPPLRAALAFDNGFGGVAADGAYQIAVQGDRVPPAPWVNVIANERGGFVVSERGGGFTWAGNSYFFRLTPWHNDPVSDPPSEVVYLRDDESGEVWSATPAPIREEIPFTIRHGAGISWFEHERAGIRTRLTLGLAEEDPVKIAIVTLTNRRGRPRRLTVTTFVEWALGVLREHTQHQVHTRFDPGLGTIFGQNFFDAQFAGWVAFHTLSEVITGHTADRREFLGRNRSLADPVALHQVLAGATGAGFDPCAALRCQVTLQPGETRELAVLLGAAEGEAEAARLVAAYRQVEAARAAVSRTTSRWQQRLSVITVRTPEPSFDIMLNHWTLYQTLSCRIWARAALYQSSGAYGFRDQLQDILAMVHAEPALARAHILRAAARQFVEGDVQHWWHPQSGRGVRTRFSDDLAWLPYVVDHYVTVTGDGTVLDEVVPFLTMRALEPHEHEIYDLPQVAAEAASVYQHGLRALRKACTVGGHDLPLMGIGDWNDGMSRVGLEGRGESVWLAWFLVTTLRSFAARAESRGDTAVASDFRARADAYLAAIEKHGWDGQWYRRAYFDDGSPLGTAGDEECRIDAIAQSWSVISGAGQPERQAQALRSFEKHLVREDARLIMLLTPPFDKTPRDPGYIKGYLPGVRENGAQYTHAALWSVMAAARSGQVDRAFELFQMINPLTHARTPEEVAVYKVEPYVLAADVYTATGHVGRGGWTWYTGSASWMYRVGLEEILGFTRRGNTLEIRPRVPAAWPSYDIDYRFGSSLYRITVYPHPDVPPDVPVDLPVVRPVVLDGRRLEAAVIPLVDDGKTHEVRVGCESRRPG
jgi:cyclic beta-1,2-glucan synthetase